MSFVISQSYDPVSVARGVVLMFCGEIVCLLCRIEAREESVRSDFRSTGLSEWHALIDRREKAGHTGFVLVYFAGKIYNGCCTGRL